MAFNVASLPDYVNQKGEIIGKALGSSKTIKVIDIQPDNKGKASLNNYTTSINFQDGSVCGFNDSGNDTISQRILEAPLLKVDKAFCIKELEKKFLAERVKKGADNYDDQAIVDSFTGYIQNAVSVEVENIIWKSEKEDVPAANNEWIDGFLTILTEEGGPQLSGSTAAGSIIATVNAVAAAIPTEVLDSYEEDNKPVIFMGQDTFRVWTAALTAANLFHYVATEGDAKAFELTVPGTDIKVFGVRGLNGTKAIVGGAQKNFVFGTDLESDVTDSEFRIWFSQDTNTIRLSFYFRAGVQVRYPDQIVYNQGE